jgi:hypothetical protein
MLRHHITTKTVILWISVHAQGMAQNRGMGIRSPTGLLMYKQHVQ